MEWVQERGGEKVEIGNQKEVILFRVVPKKGTEIYQWSEEDMRSKMERYCDTFAG